MTLRTPTATRPAFQVQEGTGNNIYRVLGHLGYRHLGGIIVFDHFQVDQSGGFPDHPHRGQKTVSYLLKGSIKHADFMGHLGVLKPGQVQIMKAGEGVVHAEMPEGQDMVEGVQIWVVDRTMGPPEYSNYHSRKEVINNGYRVNVATETDFEMWEYNVESETKLIVKHDWTAVAYDLNKKIANYYEPAIEGQEEILIHPGRFILVLSSPYEHQIVQRGLFVGKSMDDIKHADRDFREGINGFERRVGWSSEIGVKRGILYRDS